MNERILTIGSQISELRRLLNWTQDELSERLGVSRPTIINIEKDPSKFSKTLALALVATIISEIHTKRQEIEKIDFSLWDKKESRQEMVEGIESALRFTGTTIAFLFPRLIVSPIGVVIGALALSKLPKIFAGTASANSPEADKITSVQLKQVTEESLIQLEKSIAQCLGVPDLSIKSVVGLIQQINSTPKSL